MLKHFVFRGNNQSIAAIKSAYMANCIKTDTMPDGASISVVVTIHTKFPDGISQDVFEKMYNGSIRPRTGNMPEVLNTFVTALCGLAYNDVELVSYALINNIFAREEFTDVAIRTLDDLIL